MTNIFISYSRNDRQIVQQMATALQQDGFNVWWDREIPPGSTFADVIDKRLNEAHCVLVIWSSSSVKSNWVQEEADDGLQSGRLIPVMIEEIDLPRGFKRLQTANLINWRGDRAAPEWVSVVSEVRRLVAQGQAASAPKAAAPRIATPKPAAPKQSAPKPVARKALPSHAPKQPNAASSRRTTPQPAARQAPVPTPKKSGGAGAILGLVAVFVVALGAGGYFFLKSKSGEVVQAEAESHPIASSELQTAEATVPAPDVGAALNEGVAEPADGNLTVLAAADTESMADPVDEVPVETTPEVTDVEPNKPQPGEIIQDCGSCPELVVIAAGASVMGAPDGERSSEAVETPQIQVRLDYSFAIGRFEVTHEQWAACLADGGCGAYEPSDNGWGRGNRPVINVSYDNALEYVAWLSAKTGAKYRLPSESEWEFAARSGTTTPFSTGDTISTRQANFNGQYPYAGGAQERSAGKTLAVGSFSPNAFGIFDTQGNVWEWVSDCWKPSHRDADPSGTPVGGVCSQRVLKGGAWNGGAWRARSAHRKPAKSSTGDYDAGFRVVREL